MKLVVGLGNPGLEYERTRHNAGFIFLEHFLKEKGLELNKNKFKGRYCNYKDDEGNNAILLEPLTYMNLSGESISALADFYKIPNKDILVIHDDLDLDVGRIRIRHRGSSGGHNGIKSIIHCCNGEDFNRVRVGIGKSDKISTIDYVLGKFSDEEYDLLVANFDRVNQVIEEFIKGIDFHKIESKYN